MSIHYLRAQALIGTSLVVALTTGWGSIVRAQEQSWTKIVYISGASEAFSLVRPVKATWDNMLVVSSSLIGLKLRDGTRIQIDPTRVHLLMYYGASYKTSPGTKAISLALYGPAGLVFWRSPKDHFIVMEYTLADGRASGILLRAHKDNFKQVLDALTQVTKVPVTGPPAPE